MRRGLAGAADPNSFGSFCFSFLKGAKRSPTRFSRCNASFGSKSRRAASDFFSAVANSFHRTGIDTLRAGTFRAQRVNANSRLEIGVLAPVDKHFADPQIFRHGGDEVLGMFFLQ